MMSKLRRQIEKDEDVIETIIGFLSNAVWCMRNNNKNDEEIAHCLGTSTEMIDAIVCENYNAISSLLDFSKKIKFNEGDIDFYNKVENLDCELSEIYSDEMIETIKCDREIRRLAEIYILTHYELYEDDIILETRRLYYEGELIDDENDFASGLYNMDELYLKAIDYAINKRKRKEC